METNRGRDCSTKSRKKVVMVKITVKRRFYLCESNPQSASATLGGVTALKFWSLHCGVQRTCRVVVPTGMSIASTCAGELSWSVDPGFNCGALAVRADGRSWNLAPLGPARICTCIFLSSIVRVAVEPEESMLIVPLVWTRHCAAAVTVNSSCKRICLRALRKRMPRLTALEEKKGLEQSIQLVPVYSLSAVSSAQVDDHASGRVAGDVENG